MDEAYEIASLREHWVKAPNHTKQPGAIWETLEQFLEYYRCNCGAHDENHRGNGTDIKAT